MRRVLIIQSEMKHYRVPFFTGLYNVLQNDGVDLRVAYSNSNALHAPRQDRAELPPLIGYRVRGRWFFRRFVYQNLWRQIFSSDLVIIGPEAKYLLNPALMILSRLGLKTVAFWGLGPNKHPDRSPFAEWVKQHFFTFVDWWFAYTASIGEYLEQRGMPKDKITIVQNATDTTELRRYLAGISEVEASESKTILTGSRSSSVGLYCGLIGEIKEMPMLLEAAKLVKSQKPEFHLVIIGDGPDRSWLQQAITDLPWVHYLGFKGHKDAALYYRIADIFLLAGTVGLAVVDSFAAGLPLLATRLETHPPEISYVIDRYNTLLTDHDASSLAEGVIQVLSDAKLKESLRQGALESGSTYTMEAMVENYRRGIHRCLIRYRGASFPESSERLTSRVLGK